MLQQHVPKPKANPRFKNRQMHFREDLVFLLVAAWQPVLMFKQHDWDVTACGRKETWKAMFLDVALFPESTPTSSSPARDMFWSSAALHPSGRITGEDGLNMAPPDPQRQPRAMVDNILLEVRNRTTSSPKADATKPCRSCDPSSARTGKKMSLVEYSVHKLFIFIQYGVIFIPNLHHLISFLSWGKRNPAAPKHHDFCMVSNVYKHIYSVFLLTVSHTVHKHTVPHTELSALDWTHLSSQHIQVS